MKTVTLANLKALATVSRLCITQATMSRGRSTSPHPLRDEDVDMDNTTTEHVDKPNAKVVIVTNLTRNVVEAHLQTIFGFYGELTKVDLPLFGKCEFKCSNSKF